MTKAPLFWLKIKFFRVEFVVKCYKNMLFTIKYLEAITIKISKAISNQNIFFTISGRLDTLTTPQLEDEIKNTSFENTENVILNMSELEYISSLGLRVILSLYKLLKKQNSELKIINVSNSIMELFSMAGLANYINIETS